MIHAQVTHYHYTSSCIFFTSPNIFFLKPLHSHISLNLQGGPLPGKNGVTTPINGLYKMGNWGTGVINPINGVKILLVTSDGAHLVPACFCQHIRFYVSMALPVSSQKSSNDEGSSRGGFRDKDSDFKKWFERGPWTWNDRPRATNPPADSHLCEACVCFLNLRIFGPSFRVVWLCIAEFCYGISILLEPLDS